MPCRPTSSVRALEWCSRPSHCGGHLTVAGGRPPGDRTEISRRSGGVLRSGQRRTLAPPAAAPGGRSRVPGSRAAPDAAAARPGYLLTLLSAGWIPFSREGVRQSTRPPTPPLIGGDPSGSSKQPPEGNTPATATHTQATADRYPTLLPPSNCERNHVCRRRVACRLPARRLRDSCVRAVRTYSTLALLGTRL